MSALTLIPVIDRAFEARQHPDGVLHDRVVCPTCVLDRIEGQTFLVRCAGECGAVTPHTVTGSTSGECVFCGTERWV